MLGSARRCLTYFGDIRACHSLGGEPRGPGRATSPMCVAAAVAPAVAVAVPADAANLPSAALQEERDGMRGPGAGEWATGSWAPGGRFLQPR